MKYLMTIPKFFEFFFPYFSKILFKLRWWEARDTCKWKQGFIRLRSEAPRFFPSPCFLGSMQKHAMPVSASISDSPFIKEGKMGITKYHSAELRD